MTRHTCNRTSRARAISTSLFAFTATLGEAAASHAQSLPGTFGIDDSDPVASVPTPEEALEKPLDMGYHVLELADRADAADRRGEHAQAARYYLAIAKAAPDRAIGYSKACASFEQAEMWTEASDACRHALGTDGVTGPDFMRFASTTLRKPNLSPSEVDDVQAVLDEVEPSASNVMLRRDFTALRCQLAARSEHPEKLARCAAAVREWPADEPRRLAFLVLEALGREDWSAARAAVDEARRAGMPAAVLKRTTSQIDQSERTARAQQPALAEGWSGKLPKALGLLVLGLLGAAAFWRRRTRLVADAR